MEQAAPDMNEALAGYLAGFFDGEGTVYAATRTGRTGTRDRRPTATIMVCISNTNKAVLDVHHALFGGSLNKRKGKNYETGNWREQWQWMLSPRQARPYLKAMYPHLLIKKEVVGIALEYMEIVSRPRSERWDYSGRVQRPGKHGMRWQVSPCVKPDILEQLLALHARIRELNARGAPFNARRQRNPWELAADAAAAN